MVSNQSRAARIPCSIYLSSSLHVNNPSHTGPIVRSSKLLVPHHVIGLRALLRSYLLKRDFQTIIMFRISPAVAVVFGDFNRGLLADGHFVARMR